MNILHIDSSASDPATSYSRRLSAEVIRRLKEKNPDASVSYRDLAADPLPHVDMTIREAWGSENSEDASLAATRTRSSRLVDELKSADIVVIGSPMYNFTVPSTLKSWIDHVAIAGQTFKYDEQGPKGLLTGKAYLALSSGGVYSQGPFSSADHLSTYLTAIFNFVGITDIEIVRAEGVAYGPKQAESAMAAARGRIATLGA